MTGSPSAIVTLGLGTWGSVNLLTTLGYGQGEAVIDPSTLYGWLETTALGRLHVTAEGRLHTTALDEDARL